MTYATEPKTLARHSDERLDQLIVKACALMRADQKAGKAESAYAVYVDALLAERGRRRGGA